MDEEFCHYPIFLNVREKECLVVGGGKVAERRVLSLLERGAFITVISPEFTPRLSKLDREGRLRSHRRPFEKGDLGGQAIVLTATGDEEVDRVVLEAAAGAGILANSADGSADSAFLLPSVGRRGPVQMAVSTGGKSPAMSRFLKQYLISKVGREHEALSIYLGSLRARVRSRFPNEADRRAFWDRLTSEEIVRLARARKWDQIEEVVQACLSS